MCTRKMSQKPFQTIMKGHCVLQLAGATSKHKAKESVKIIIEAMFPSKVNKNLIVKANPTEMRIKFLQLILVIKFSSS